MHSRVFILNRKNGDTPKFYTEDEIYNLMTYIGSRPDYVSELIPNQPVSRYESNRCLYNEAEDLFMEEITTDRNIVGTPLGVSHAPHTFSFLPNAAQNYAENYLRRLQVTSDALTVSDILDMQILDTAPVNFHLMAIADFIRPSYTWFFILDGVIYTEEQLVFRNLDDTFQINQIFDYHF